MEYREFVNNLRTAFNKLRSFDKRIEYVRGALPVIGSGSSRIVFDIDDKHVLKLAKNQKGIAQNEVEVTIGSYDENKYILTNIFDSDDNYTWVVSEKAKKITPKRFKELVGIDIRYIYLGVKNQLSRDQTPIPDDIQEILYENEFASEIHDLCANHSVSVGDLDRISSYGEAIRYGEPSVVVTDYGLNDEIFKDYYSKSNSIYEIFNNFDGNDDILSDIGGEIDIRGGGAAFTSTPEYVDERELKYMQNSSSVKVKDKCLLGHSKEICNKGDINNLIIDVMTESIEPIEADDVVGSIQTIIENKRDLGFAPFLNRDQISLLNNNGVGILPIKRDIGVGYVMYRNKQKAHELYQYLLSKNGYLTDNTPEEAIFVGKLLGYSDSSINKYVNDRYKLAKLNVDTRTPDDFNDLDEEIVNEGDIMSLQDLPFKDEVFGLGGNIFSVGGAVRDEFIGKKSKDLDILVTGIPLEKLEQILSKYGRVDAVGKSFGILKFKPKGATEDIDVAIPRTEKPTGEGGHKGFDVVSDHNLSLEDDLFRRDLTINAIAKDINGKIIDPFHGVDDLNNKIIRVVNPDAFSDDPLRMLRAVQFSARFGFEIEPKTMELIQKSASSITSEPFDRVLTEFGKIVEKGNPLIGAKLLQTTGLYNYIFGKTPRLSFIGRPFDNVKTLGEFVFLLIYGVWDDPSDYFKRTMKGNNDSFNEMRSYKLAYDSVVNKNLSIGALRSLAHNMFVMSQYSITSGIISGELAKACQDLSSGRYPKTVNDLTVRGNDLKQMGLEGKEIGDLQKKILSDIYFDKISNDRDSIMSSIDQTKTIENEGVGDKYAEKAFGIPDQDVVFDKYFNTSKPNNLGEPSSYINARVSYDDGYSEKVNIPLYVNPKTINSFDSEVRAIVDKNGNIYVAFIDGYFDHGEMAEALKLDVGGYSSYNIYNHPQNYVLLVRIGKTNTFGFSDTSSGNYINYMYEIDALLEKAKLKNPQFIFDKRYYGDIKGLIGESNDNKTVKEQLMNSKSISTEMKEKISEYLTSNSEYIMGGRVLGLSQPSGFTSKTPKSSGVSLGADKNGFYCYTHRASSKRYKTPEKIPVTAIEFIESTG